MMICLDRDLAAGEKPARVDLCCRIAADLSASNFPRLRHITIEANRDSVTLRGQLHSFHERQMALALAERACGATRVIDELSVCPR